jgi:hypothetical protein
MKESTVNPPTKKTSALLKKIKQNPVYANQIYNMRPSLPEEAGKYP